MWPVTVVVPQNGPSSQSTAERTHCRLAIWRQEGSCGNLWPIRLLWSNCLWSLSPAPNIHPSLQPLSKTARLTSDSKSRRHRLHTFHSSSKHRAVHRWDQRDAFWCLRHWCFNCYNMLCSEELGNFTQDSYKRGIGAGWDGVGNMDCGTWRSQPTVVSLLIRYSPMASYFCLSIIFPPPQTLQHAPHQHYLLCDSHDHHWLYPIPIAPSAWHHIVYLPYDLWTTLFYFPFLVPFLLPNSSCYGLTDHKPSHRTVRTLPSVLPHTNLVLVLLIICI